MFSFPQTAWFYMYLIQVNVHAGGVFNGLLCLDTYSSVYLYVYFHSELFCCVKLLFNSSIYTFPDLI